MLSHQACGVTWKIKAHNKYYDLKHFLFSFPEQILNTGGQLAMRAAPPPPSMQPQQQQPNNRQVQQQQQQINNIQQQPLPVYQQPHQHQLQNDGTSSNYDIYDEYSGGGSGHYNNSTGAPQSTGSNSHPNSIHYGSDGGYESSQVSIQQQQDVEMERRLSFQQQMGVGGNGQIAQPPSTLHTVSSTPNMLAQQQQIPPTTISSPELTGINSQVTQQTPSSPHTNQHPGGDGHHRMGCAPPNPPPAPPPPPGGLFMGPPAAPPAPAPPPPPALGTGPQIGHPSGNVMHAGTAPPPPPPPMPNLHASQSSDHVGGLAAALQAAKLKKTNRGGSAENSGGSTTSSNSSGYGTMGNKKDGNGGGMVSMMDEMQKTLARRRAKVDKEVEVSSLKISS